MPLVLVLDVNQVEEGTLLGVEFELLFSPPRAVVIFILIGLICLNVKDTGLVARWYLAAFFPLHEEPLGRRSQRGDLIGINRNCLSNGMCCMLGGLQPIPFWVLSMWLVPDRQPLIF